MYAQEKSKPRIGQAEQKVRGRAYLMENRLLVLHFSHQYIHTWVNDMVVLWEKKEKKIQSKGRKTSSMATYDQNRGKKRGGESMMKNNSAKPIMKKRLDPDCL